MKKSFSTIVVLFTLIMYPSQIFAADTSTLQTQLMTYLPYILIGGAVILLISIVGILLSKKKEKTEEVSIPSVVPTTETVTPVEPMPDIAMPAPAVNMDNISTNLYTPAVSAPTIQETIEANPLTEEQPIVQPEFAQTTVPASEQAQSADLKDILQGEASAAPMGPVTDHVMEEPLPTPSLVSNPMQETAPITEPSMDMQFSAPTMEQVTPVAEPVMDTQFSTPTMEQVAPAVPDLQQFINNQVAEVPPMAAPIMDTPAPVVAPVEDFNPAPTDTTTPTQTGTPFSI